MVRALTFQGRSKFVGVSGYSCLIKTSACLFSLGQPKHCMLMIDVFEVSAGLLLTMLLY